MTKKEVIIVGASVRAAAESAAAAGYHVHAFDLFADEDLARVAATTQLVDDYPQGLIRALEAAPSNAPWCYTGGIENYPELIAQLCQRRPLLGNSAAIVNRVREPAWLAEVAARAGWQMPKTLTSPAQATFANRTDTAADSAFAASVQRAPGRVTGSWIRNSYQVQCLAVCFWANQRLAKAAS